jgi:hypothetical protein
VSVDTVNYDPSLEERLRHPIQHLYKVTVLPAAGAAFDLAVDGELSMSYSLGWSPYAQASVRVKTPSSDVQLAVLDGRLDTYVRISLGYALDGGTEDLHESAVLRVQDVAEDVLAGTMRITLQGREMAHQDASWNDDWNGLINRAGVREAIEYVLAQSMGGAVTLTGTGTGHRPDLVANINPADGENIWSLASSIANSAGLKLWHDGGSLWKLLPRYTTSETSYATMLRTGKTGTITSITRNLNRSEWFNQVRIHYPDVGITGIGQVTSGPYSYFNVGLKEHRAEVRGWASQDSANAAARALLSTLSARGYSYNIQAAAAYWIRPGMTVPVKIGRAPYERQLVESVTFTPLNGLMTLDTIKNEDGVIS